MRAGYWVRWNTALAVLAVACGGTKTPTPGPAGAGSMAAAAGGSSGAASSTAGATSSAGGASTSAEPAVSAAKSWLALVDAAKYLESWQAAAPLFQNGVSADDWASAAAKVRAPLGKLLSRQLRTAVYQTAVPGAPEGKYVIIQFDSAFEMKARATETITPMQGADGSWKVAGYFIK